MAGPKHPPPLRRGVQTADRAVVRERQAIPGDQGRARHRAIDPAAPGPRHPRQRLHPGRGQPHARAERAGRAGEARPTVGDGGGRFRTSGAGIRTKAGVIRANAARYPISARCGIPGVPRSTYYWMTGHPGTERADCVSASWCPQYGHFFQQRRRLVSNRNRAVGTHRPFLPGYLVMRACPLR